MIQKNTLRIADFLPQARPLPASVSIDLPQRRPEKADPPIANGIYRPRAVKLGGDPSLLPSSFLPPLPSHFHSLVFASYRIIFHSFGGRFYNFK